MAYVKKLELARVFVNKFVEEYLLGVLNLFISIPGKYAVHTSGLKLSGSLY